MRYKKHLLIIVCAVAINAVFSFSIPAEKFAFRNFPDDALFYNIIARNVAQGIGTSSDGIAMTNGFHPLWMLVVLGFTMLPFDILSMEIAFQLLLSLATLGLLYHFFLKYTSPMLALGICVIISCEESCFGVLYNGMESALALFFLVAFLLLLQKKASSLAYTWHTLFLSLCLCFMFFSRLDGGLLWPAFALAFLTQASGKTFLSKARYIFYVMWLPALSAGLYFIYNIVHYSSFMPISGRIKALNFSQIIENGFQAYLFESLQRLFFLYYVDLFVRPLRGILKSDEVGSSWTFLLLYTFILLIIIGAAIYFYRRTNSLDLALRTFLGFIIFHSVYYSLFQSDTYSLKWAHGPQLILFFLAVTILLSRFLGLQILFRKSLIMRGILCALLLISIGFHSLRSQKIDKIHDFNLGIDDFSQAVQFVQAQTSPEALFASRNIGFFGFLSGRNVVSVDGLLNSKEYYLNYKKQGKILEYLLEHDVQYLIEAVPKERESFTVLTERYPGLTREQIKQYIEFHDNVTNPRVTRSYVFVEITSL